MASVRCARRQNLGLDYRKHGPRRSATVAVAVLVQSAWPLSVKQRDARGLLVAQSNAFVSGDGFALRGKARLVGGIWRAVCDL